jgi:hypothetical protein
VALVSGSLDQPAGQSNQSFPVIGDSVSPFRSAGQRPPADCEGRGDLRGG